MNVGGPAIHAVLLSSSLKDRGWIDVLVCGKISEHEGDMYYLAREKGLEPLVIDELGREINPKKDFAALRKLYSIMKKEKPDIVHTHTAKAGAIGRLAAILAGVPVKVHTFHGHVFDGYFSPLKARIFILIEKILALFTDKVIVVSEGVKREVTERLKIVSEKKSIVIPLGLELDKFLLSEDYKGVFRKEMGIKGDTLLVGIIGRLVPIKNHKMFIDAALKIKSALRDYDIKFLVIGDGELRLDLEAYTKKIGMAGTIIFTGWIRDLAKVYADLDLVTLTSLNEGTPVSLIEAMAASKAVVSTDVGGVADLVKDGYNGLLTKADDVDAFCKKAVSILTDPLRRAELGDHAMRSVADKYSKNRLVHDIDALYKELLKKRGIL